MTFACFSDFELQPAKVQEYVFEKPQPQGKPILYSNTSFLVKKSNISLGGNGLFAGIQFPPMILLGKYQGRIRTSVSKQKERRTTHSKLDEDYAIDLPSIVLGDNKYQHRTIMPFPGECFAMYANDLKIPSLANAGFYLHKDEVYLVSLRTIFAEEEIYVSYGPQSWKRRRPEGRPKEGKYSKRKRKLEEFQELQEEDQHYDLFLNKIKQQIGPNFSLRQRITAKALQEKENKDDKFRARWRKVGGNHYVVAVCPSMNRLDYHHARWVLDLEPNMQVLDCIGYSPALFYKNPALYNLAAQIAGAQAWLVLERKERKFDARLNPLSTSIYKDHPLWDFPEIQYILWDPCIRWDSNTFAFYYAAMPQVKKEEIVWDKETQQSVPLPEVIVMETLDQKFKIKIEEPDPEQFL